jgi:CheY-like chemotaxis protein
MKSPLRILHLEDNTFDAELCHALMTAEGLELEVTHATNADEFRAALERGGFDLILSDYSLPDYDGRRALARVRATDPHVPFILVSGELGEEAAIDALKSGATDYVLKMRLSRLVPAVRRAVAEAKARADRLLAEQAVRERDQLLRAILGSLSAHIAVIDPTGVIIAVNEAWTEFGEKNGATAMTRAGVGMNYLEVCRQAAATSPEAAAVVAGIEAVLQKASPRFVLEYACPSATEARWFLLDVTPLTTLRRGAVLSHVDVTARKRAELERQAMEQRLRQAERLASLGQLAASVVGDLKPGSTEAEGTGPSDPFRDFSGLLQNFERLLDAAKTETASAALIAEAEAARSQVNEQVVFNLCKLLVALAGFKSSDETESIGTELGENESSARLVAALQETIEVLEGTKRSFKSKALGQLRTKLEAIVRAKR